MVDHVAKTLCRAAASSNDNIVSCAFCDKVEGGRAILGECLLWPTFLREARCAIEAVRDYARLDRRNKPRERQPIEIVAEQAT